MGVRCRDCGRESRLEPQCLERPSTPLIQLLFSCKSYQHFLLTPTITPHSWALFSLFTAHQGEGSERERRQREEAEEGKEKWNILAPDFNWQNGSALSFSPRSPSLLHHWHRIHFPVDSLYVSWLWLCVLTFYFWQATVCVCALATSHVIKRQKEALVFFFQGHGVSLQHLCQHTNTFLVAFFS